MIFTFTITPPVVTARRYRPATDPLGATVLWANGTRPLNARKDYVVITGPDALDQFVRHVGMTHPGEVATDPSYGVGMLQLLNQAFTPTTKAETERRWRDALSRFRGIKSVDEVSVTREVLNGQDAMRVLIVYTAKDGDQRSSDTLFKKTG